MRIRIDDAACTGHGRCYAEAPAVFDSDENGQGVVVTPDVPPELEDQARRAEASCPERAITIDE